MVKPIFKPFGGIGYDMARQKVKIGIAVSPEILEWIDRKVKEKVFANRSHAFEYAIYQLMKKEGAEGK